MVEVEKEAIEKLREQGTEHGAQGKKGRG